MHLKLKLRVQHFCRPEHREADDVIELPYYGGAKGQVLQIKTSPDGSIVSEIVKQKMENHESNEYKPHLPIRVNSLLSSPTEIDKSSFLNDLNSIKASAQKLVDLHQSVKHRGNLSNEEQKLYAENLEIIGNSAQKLIKVEKDEAKVGENNLSDTKKKVIPAKMEDEEHYADESGDDSIQVNSPPDDASVAEAKPVGKF